MEFLANCQFNEASGKTLSPSLDLDKGMKQQSTTKRFRLW